MGITAVGASIISGALNNNTTLKRLFLSGNRLCDEGVQALTKALSFNKSNVDILALQLNSITDEGAGYLAEMLTTNTTLKFLSLSRNGISDRGVQHLIDVLIHQNATLISLRIDGNKLVSDSSVDALVKMLQQNRTVNCLDIEGCNLSEKGKERLRPVARSKKDFRLII